MSTPNNFRNLLRCLAGFCIVTTVLIGVSVNAQTIMVTTSADTTDVADTATIDDLPGPDGVVSFREALLASDNTAGHQTVGFEIPEDDWYLSDIYPGQVLLQGSFSFGASQPVTIDGTTQTAYTGDTYPDGNEVILPLQTYLSGFGNVVTGLHATRIEILGSLSEVYGNTGSMYIVVAFSAASVIRDNEADTIKIDTSSNNIVVRNTTERVRINGGGPNRLASGNLIGGPDPADRNFITGWGNVGEHGSPGGDTVELYFTNNTLIENNYIGTTPDGMAIGNHASTVGVGVYSVNHNLTVRNNLIAIQAHYGGGNSGPALGAAIYLNMYEGGNNVRIFGNTLGLNALGEPLLGAADGVLVNRYAFEYGADVQIGGPNPGEGNIIAGHESSGVLMFNGPGIPPTGHIRLSGNSIYGNGEIGIDLMPNTWDFGPTPNDPLDADVIGANRLQNYPEIFTATNNGLAIQTTGQLHSVPLKDYTIEFFASPECDPSGFGQGQMFLGSTSVSTDAAGNAPFDVSLSATVPDGWVITSTATLEPIGETSEFSACLPIESQTITQVASDSFNVLRGFFVSGTLADTFDSDDSYLKFKPGITLNNSEPPVWLEFVGTLPSDAPTSLSVTLEAQANTLGLAQTIDMFNWNSGQYEPVDSRAASFNTDSVATVNLTASISDYVQSGTGTVKTRMGWRATGPVLLYPWTASIDQVIWSVQ